MKHLKLSRLVVVFFTLGAATPAFSSHLLPDSIEIADFYKLQSAGDPQRSPDGIHVAFTVSYTDRPGAPYTRIWIMDLKTGKAGFFGTGPEGNSPRWSPDGRKLAFFGSLSKDVSGLIVGNADGSGLEKVAETQGTNHPAPMMGNRLSWSSDNVHVAFVSAVAGPEPDMEADPIVITRYWFRPASSAGGRFNDNRRLHIFIADVSTKQVKQITQGTYAEHSISWSPDGKQIAFLSNHEPDPDFFNNYDIFTIDVATGEMRAITKTRSNEFFPTWSPDGKTIAYSALKRLINSSETNMEDTHVWTVDVLSGNRTEVGGSIDNRQGAPQWSRDGKWIYFTVQSHGSTTLHRMMTNGKGDEIVAQPPQGQGNLGGFTTGTDHSIIASVSSTHDVGQLFQVKEGKTSQLTSLNAEFFKVKKVAPVEAYTIKSVDGLKIESFLTKPLNIVKGKTYPMIVNIHGGPHGQQGPNFTLRNQVYAAHGYAVLMVNYRGSTGYGQGFSNAIAKDQNGMEAKDILAAIDSALIKYPWIDGMRLGVEGQSYGGQLTNWLVTQTNRFAAAIPAASISNLVTQNYMSVYHDYLEQEYDVKPHLNGVVEQLWERSAIRIVYKVKTPVMFIHGDNDQLVNPAEIEQFYIALKDIGVETMMVRYPREGHGIRESKHLADILQRSMAWYDGHFGKLRVKSEE